MAKLIGFPEPEGPFPFVRRHIQLYVSEEPILIFGKQHHSDILQEFLDNNGLDYELVKTIDGNVPSLGGKKYQYHVVGAGLAKIFQGKLICSEKSFLYRIPTNHSHLEEIKPHLPKFITEVEIE